MFLSNVSDLPEQTSGRRSQTITIDSLNQAEQLVLLTLRRYIEDRHCSAQVAMTYWFACGPGYVEKVLGGFEEVMGLLPAGLRRDMKIAHTTVNDLTHDEWALLNLMAAVQHRDLELVEKMSHWLFVSSMEKSVTRVIENLMTVLSTCGLRFPARHRHTRPESLHPVVPNCITDAPASAG